MSLNSYFALPCPASLLHFTQIVVLQKPGDNNNSDAQQLDAAGVVIKTDLVLPPLEHNDEETSSSSIPNCTICLCDYRGGDNICWSHNFKCQHHFHKVCIMEWLQNHDECPCCRHNYLALSDDEDDDEEENTTGDDAAEPAVDTSTQHRGDFDFAFITNPFARLYHHSTGPYFATDDTVPTTTTSPPPPPQRNDNQNQWNERLERTVDRVRSQVRTQLDRFQDDRREHRNEMPRQQQQQRNDQDNDDDLEPGATNPPFEDRVERSIRLVRNQLGNLRTVVNREISNQRAASAGQSNNNGARDSDTRNTNEEDPPSWRRALEMVRTHASRIQEQINSNERPGNRN
jgi:hypothetical protein